MPAKSGKLHAHIDPGDGNSTNLFIIFLSYFKDGWGGFINIVKVPKIGSIIEAFIAKFRGLKLWKPWAKLMRWQISSILNSFLILLLQFRIVSINTIYHLPILIFHACLMRSSYFFKFELVGLLIVFSVVSKGFNAILFFFLIKSLYNDWEIHRNGNSKGIAN
jgi:hypothetical protein